MRDLWSRSMGNVKQATAQTFDIDLWWAGCALFLAPKRQVDTVSVSEMPKFWIWP